MINETVDKWLDINEITEQKFNGMSKSAQSKLNFFKFPQRNKRQSFRDSPKVITF